MNVIFALQAFRSREFARDITRQKNADIIARILTKVNARTAPTHVVKVKSHWGVHLNELADRAADEAAGADAKDGVQWDYEMDIDRGGMLWSWPTPAQDPTHPDEIKSSSTPREVLKQWQVTAEKQMARDVQTTGTLGGTFLVTDYWGHHLLHKSHLQSP